MIEFEPKTSRGREFLTGMFAIWGMGGFAAAAFAALVAPALTAIVVFLLWIGGFAFFGFAALISSQTYQIEDPGLPVYVVTAPGADFEDRQH